MTVEKQRTIAKEAVFTGIGLHSGTEAKVTLKPLDADAGLVIKTAKGEERLRPSLAKGSAFCNSLGIGESDVSTVEHLLAAAWGIGVDNLLIEVEGTEIPGLDGSAADFVKGILAVGTVEQDSPKKVFIPKEPISVGTAEAGIVAYPSADGRFSVTYILDYKESKHAQGALNYQLNYTNFPEDLAPARTFVMKQHADAMLAAGLGKGANSQNTIVLDADVVVDNKLRFPDECIRHKILDIIGDLSILNRRLGVHIIASKSGHRLNTELVQALAKALTKADNPSGIMDIREISAILPHRYPFLLVDRVIEMEPKKSIVAYKNLTGNEGFFQGHFPGQPIMPGVLQIEAMAQAGAIMMLGELHGQGKLAVLMTAEDVKWRRQVVPGDRLYLHAEAVKFKGRIGVVRVWSTVDGDVTVEALIKFALIDADGAKGV